MKKFLLSLVACLAGVMPAASQNIGGFPLLTAPATNDWVLGADVSDTTTATNGTLKRFDALAFSRLAETTLRSLTTTGGVSAGSFVLASDGSALLEMENHPTAGPRIVAKPFGGSVEFLNNELLLQAGGSVHTFDTSGRFVLGGRVVLSDGIEGDGSDLTGIPQFATAGTFTAAQTFQDIAGIQNNHGDQSGAFNANLTTNRHRVRATGNVTATITGTAPAAPAVKVLEFEFVQDDPGGRTFTLSPTPANGQPAVSAAASTTTLVQVRTSDGGATWFASSGEIGAGDLDEGAVNDLINTQIEALGVRSEFIPAAYMVTGFSGGAGAAVEFGNTGTVRGFGDTGSSYGNVARFVWQRPRDAVDGDGGAADFQLKWRWAAWVPSSGGSFASENLAFTLEGRGYSHLDVHNSSTWGPASVSQRTALTAANNVRVYGPWSEVTVTYTADGWVTFQVQLDRTITEHSFAHVWLSHIELLYAVNPRNQTYASP
jgi:hypothetical protein